MVMILMMI